MVASAAKSVGFLTMFDDASVTDQAVLYDVALTNSRMFVIISHVFESDSSGVIGTDS